jgi:urease accessory protein
VDAHPELVLMLLADARLPTSGHTQSGGLEPALANGLLPDELDAYCRSRLATVVRVEAGTAVVARAAVLCRGSSAGGSLVGGSLDDVEDAWAARTPSAALRTTSHALGRALTRLALRLWPDDARLDPLRDIGFARPVVLGAVAAVAGLSAEQLVRLVGYDDVQTVVSAGLKLEPADPVVAARRVLDLQPDVEALVLLLAGLTAPADVPASAAPLIEEWAQIHAITTRRLFSA